MARKFVLALDTTGSRLNLGLSNFEDSSRMRSLPLGRSLSTDLHLCLQEFMEPQAWSDLGAIAVIVGPGSYTGSRMGVVTARMLAQSLDIPLYGFSSLAIASAISSHGAENVAVSIGAQRNHVYGGIYQTSETDLEPTVIQTDQNLLVEVWQTQIDQWRDPLNVCEFEYTEQSSFKMLERMMAIAKMKLESAEVGDWKLVLPNYAQSKGV